MSQRESEEKIFSEPVDVLERAEQYGVDLSMLRANLRLPPTERVRELQRVVASVRAIQAEVASGRQQRD